MKQSREEFITQIKWQKGKRVFKHSGGYGTRHMYKYYKQNGGTLNRKQYHDVLIAIHTDFINRMLKGDLIALPWAMGALIIEKINTVPKIKDGKLYINKKIDWGKTLDLWYQDSEAREARQKVVNDTDFIYRMYYIKKDAKYINQKFVKFTPMRSVKATLRDAVREQGYLNVFYYGK